MDLNNSTNLLNSENNLLIDKEENMLNTIDEEAKSSSDGEKKPDFVPPTGGIYGRKTVVKKVFSRKKRL